MKKYDSTNDTLQHIKRVANFMNIFCDEIKRRAWEHDQSKLSSPEKEAFDILTPKLSSVEYGSAKYKEFLKELKPALEHHYANNSHHPEYYPNGINGMNLFDVIEMFCDWMAAIERNPNGSMARSVEIQKYKPNQQISEQLADIFNNTERTLKAMSKSEVSANG